MFRGGHLHNVAWNQRWHKWKKWKGQSVVLGVLHNVCHTDTRSPKATSDLWQPTCSGRRVSGGQRFTCLAPAGHFQTWSRGPVRSWHGCYAVLLLSIQRLLEPWYSNRLLFPCPDEGRQVSGLYFVDTPTLTPGHYASKRQLLVCRFQTERQNYRPLFWSQCLGCWTFLPVLIIYLLLGPQHVPHTINHTADAGIRSQSFHLASRSCTSQHPQQTALRFDHATHCLPAASLTASAPRLLTGKVSEAIGWPRAKIWPIFPLWFTSKLPVFSAATATLRPWSDGVFVDSHDKIWPLSPRGCQRTLSCTYSW